jgi:hypothetical protein
MKNLRATPAKNGGRTLGVLRHDNDRPEPFGRMQHSIAVHAGHRI